MCRYTLASQSPSQSTKQMQAILGQYHIQISRSKRRCGGVVPLETPLEMLLDLGHVQSVVEGLLRILEISVQDWTSGIVSGLLKPCRDGSAPDSVLHD